MPFGLAERLLEQRDSAVESGRDRRRRASASARGRAWRSCSHELERDRPWPHSFARSEMGPRRCDPAANSIRVRLSRRRTNGVLAELRGDDRSASSQRERSCLLELRGELGVRLLRCKRAVASARERIVDDLGQAFVRAAPGAWGGGLVEHGGEERVREADDPVCELDHVVRESGLERVGVKLIGRQSAVRAGEQQRSARLAGQPVEASAYERVQRFRHRQRLRGVDISSEGAAELESKEWIATRGFMEAQQRRASRTPGRAAVQDRLQRARD